MKSKKSASALIQSATTMAVGLLVTPMAHADLRNVPGMTPVQAPVATTIQAICPRLRAGYSSLSAPQQTLADSCTKMVQTSNAQQGVAGTGQNLGLTEQGLRDTLQGVAPEEMNAQSRSLTGAPSAPIGARLLALRRGAGGGPLASSTFNVNGQPVRLSDVFSGNGRGGGASADAGLAGPWSGFMQGHYNWGDRDTSVLEDGFDFNDYGFTGGVDYRFSDATVAGLALSYAKSDADFKRNLGNMESDSIGLSLYGSHSRDNMYVEGFLGYARVGFDSARRILAVSTTSVSGFDSTAKGSTDADQLTASVATGYDWRRDSLSVTPFVRVSYLHLDIDGFTEKESRHSLGLDVEGRSVKSLQSAIGAQIAKAISTQSGVITPYAGIEWNHEFESNGSDIVAKYTHDPFNTFFTIPTADPDRDYFTLRAGITSIFPSGVAAFANIDTVLGLKDTTSTSLTIGMRVEF